MGTGNTVDWWNCTVPWIKLLNNNASVCPLLHIIVQKNKIRLLHFEHCSRNNTLHNKHSNPLWKPHTKITIFSVPSECEQKTHKQENKCTKVTSYYKNSTNCVFANKFQCTCFPTQQAKWNWIPPNYYYTIGLDGFYVYKDN